MFESIIKQQKKIYLSITILCFSSVFFAHFFLQNYLFMRPCVQCVYIRLDMLILGFGALLSLNKNLKFIGFFFAIFGIFSGLNHSLYLENIYKLVASGNPFGASCPLEPNFLLNLPLNELFPSLFSPNGECGNDAPFVPLDANLSALQQFFLGNESDNFKDGFYSKGWFLLPKNEFLNMPQACILIFGVSLLLYFLIFVAFLKSKLI